MLKILANYFYSGRWRANTDNENTSGGFVNPKTK